MIRCNSLFVLTLFVAVLQGCGGASPEEPGIRSCFETYKKSIVAADGKASVAEIDSTTLKYYSRMLKLSLEATPAETKALGLMDKLMVLTTRHRVPADELKAMDTNAYFIYAVENGWIGDVQQNGLGDIEVKGNAATGEHLVGKQQTGMFWKFNKEDGKWKIDLTAIMPTAEKAFKQLVAQGDQDENTFLFDILEQVTGEAVKDSIWEPVNAGS